MLMSRMSSRDPARHPKKSWTASPNFELEMRAEDQSVLPQTSKEVHFKLFCAPSALLEMLRLWTIGRHDLEGSLS